MSQIKAMPAGRIETELSDLDRTLAEMKQERRERPEMDVPFAPPRTPTEEQVADLVAETLKLDRVGVDDSFYALGGNSIEAAQILLRLNETLQVDVPLRVLVTGTFTVAEIARAITQDRIEKGNADDISALLKKLEGMTEEEAEALLAAGEETDV